jgi:sterol 3beta-glucosyltransferase
VAPRGVPHNRLTGPALATALGRALTDQALRARAEDLGMLIRAEDGLARAVERIEAIQRG